MWENILANEEDFLGYPYFGWCYQYSNHLKGFKEDRLNYFC